MSRKGRTNSRSWARTVSRSARQRGPTVLSKPAFGTRVSNRPARLPFDAPERWHEPAGRREPRILIEEPGADYLHPVSAAEVRERLRQLPQRFQGFVDVVQFSRMTRKRELFPLYGLQWGTAVYLYPVQMSLVETFIQPPKPQQEIEARMYGGEWSLDNGVWRLTWTLDAIRNFYLNNILIHEVGHAVDDRNRRPLDRERFANWFAVEYGYRPWRKSL